MPPRASRRAVSLSALGLNRGEPVPDDPRLPEGQARVGPIPKPRQPGLARLGPWTAAVAGHWARHRRGLGRAG